MTRRRRGPWAGPWWRRRACYAEHGTFTTDLPTLSGFDPSLRFTSGPSTGPETVSYAVNGMVFAAAVRSESGPAGG